MCLIQFSPPRPWVLDSGVFDHISSNRHLLSHCIESQSLPTITLANGSITQAIDIGHAHHLPSLSLHSVLYLFECPFNLVSISKLTSNLNCVITFINDSFVI